MIDYNAMNDDLLVKYLVNETAVSETIAVEKWIQASDKNKQHFEQVLWLWEQSLTLNSKDLQANESDAWQRLQKRIHEMPKQLPTKAYSRRWLSIAATLLLLLGVGVIGYFLVNKNSVSQVQLVSANKVIDQQLPDGSLITVNKNSSLTYPSKFKGNTREVALNGEAFFKVAPDKTKPFIIHVNDVTVRVVGTSFDIKSKNGKTEVIVETGIVEVTKNGKTVTLKPKEKVVTDWQNTRLAKDSSDDLLYNYYISKEFICNNTPLQKLVETLNEAYNAHIIVGDEAVKQLRITTTFKNEKLENIITIICATLNLQAEKKGETLILR